MAEEPGLALPAGVTSASELPVDRRKPAPEPLPQEQRAELLRVYSRHVIGRVQRWLDEGEGDTLTVPLGPPVVAAAVVNRLGARALERGIELTHAPPGHVTATIVRV